MKIKCPACSKILTIPDSAAGKIVKCPCGKQLRAPGNAAPTQGTTGPGAGRPAPAGGPAPQSTRPGAGAGEFDPEMFDELTDQDLQPVKGVASPFNTPAASGRSGSSNPYAPAAGVGGHRVGGQGSREIASVGSRILGALIDGLFGALFVGIGLGVVFAILGSAGENPTQAQMIMVYGVMFIAGLIPAIVNIVLIAKSGQSLGKKLVGTRIVDQETYVQAGVMQGYLVRSIVFGFLTGLPVIGFFIAVADLLYLFSEKHQTLHDRLAKTLVVRA